MLDEMTHEDFFDIRAMLTYEIESIHVNIGAYRSARIYIDPAVQVALAATQIDSHDSAPSAPRRPPGAMALNSVCGYEGASGHPKSLAARLAHCVCGRHGPRIRRVITVFGGQWSCLKSRIVGLEAAVNGDSLHGMSNPIVPAFSQANGPEPANDVYQRLLRNRIVFLGTQVDDTSANLVCAQLLLLAAEDSERDISLYINSPGGSVTAGLAIYDTMQFVPCDISTVCMGLAASMGQFLLCAGTRGKRFALPHARILMHQPSGQAQGQAADIAIQAEQIIYLKRMMAERIAFHTGQPIDRIEADSDRDRWFTAQESVEYGLIDRVIESATTVNESLSSSQP